MIILEKDPGVKFGVNDKWPLLFAIADIYRKHSSEHRHLKSEDVSAYLETEYGISKVDRHVIQSYREKLEDYFGYMFNEPKGKKTGFYLVGVEKMLGDDELASLAIMVQCNSTFSQETKDITLENIASYAGNDNMRATINRIKEIQTFYGNEDPRENAMPIIQKLIEASETKSKIIIRYANPWEPRLIQLSLYPQFVFMKSNEFFLFGMDYLESSEGIISTSEVIRIKNIQSVTIKGHPITDSHQPIKGKILVYRRNEEPHKISYSDCISMLGDVSEGQVSETKLRHVINAEVSINASSYRMLVFLLDVLANKYGYGNCFSVKEFIDIANKRTGRVERKKAIISLSLPREEIMSLIFAYSRYMTILGPKELIKQYQQRLKGILEDYAQPNPASPGEPAKVGAR